eukprot:Nk52_evm24s1763 gene=Nk52_evmTU24s1763
MNKSWQYLIFKGGEKGGRAPARLFALVCVIFLSGLVYYSSSLPPPLSEPSFVWERYDPHIYNREVKEEHKFDAAQVPPFGLDRHRNGVRGAVHPFLTGDSFRAMADHVFDDEFGRGGGTKGQLNPEDVQSGQLVFLKMDYAQDFFNNCLAHIRHQIILVTHNADESIPGRFLPLLRILPNDAPVPEGFSADMWLPTATGKNYRVPKVRYWYGQNNEYPWKLKNVELPPYDENESKDVSDMRAFERLRTIPIGIGNAQWPHGDANLLYSKACEAKPMRERSTAFYLNFRVNTHRQVREPVFNRLKEVFFNDDARNMMKHLSGHSESKEPNEAFQVLNADESPVVGWDVYLDQLSNTRFLLSPRGNGIDCHRTWEGLYMGSVVVVVAQKDEATLKQREVAERVAKQLNAKNEVNAGVNQYLECSETDEQCIKTFVDDFFFASDDTSLSGTKLDLYEGLPVIILRDWNQWGLSLVKHLFDAADKGSTASILQRPRPRLFSRFWVYHFQQLQRFVLANTE